ncbi:MAG: arsenite methyltransferase, partial [Ignavibacteriales bacterium]|nr:arsenite methyltransferase [Ignavibacteriales bacterium]
MSTDEELKTIVKEKYAQIAQQSRERNASSCCGSTCGCGANDLSIMADDYTSMDGYVAEADLGLGCGIPTDGAGITTGHTVLDLGSGAGNDVFVARRLVGERGRVIGVDMTEAMIEKANENNRKLGYANVEFRLGEIENLPVASYSVDVVISNCVLNLVPDKSKAFAEIFRVLKPGGHFSISDIVVSAELPPAIQQVAALYAGCVSGALKKNEYLRLLSEAGFANVVVKKEKKIDVPDDILLEYMSN